VETMGRAAEMIHRSSRSHSIDFDFDFPVGCFFILIFRKFLNLGCRSSGGFWWSGAVIMVVGCLVRW